jgi:hypothetical protein
MAKIRQTPTKSLITIISVGARGYCQRNDMPGCDSFPKTHERAVPRGSQRHDRGPEGVPDNANGSLKLRRPGVDMEGRLVAVTANARSGFLGVLSKSTGCILPTFVRSQFATSIGKGA